MGYNINNELAYDELLLFHDTKTPSVKLCLLVRQLINNKLSNSRYCYISKEDKEDMSSQAMIDFIKWGHNFNPKPTYSKGVAIGYLDFNMNNTFNRLLKKLKKLNAAEIYTDIDVAYWDSSFNVEEYNEG